MQTNLTELAKQIINLDSEELIILNNKISLFDLSINVLKDVEKGCEVSKEDRLSELLFGLKENGFDKYDYFIKNDKKLLFYKSKNKALYISYTYIWSVFEKEFDMEYVEVKAFITKYVVDTLQIEVKDTTAFFISCCISVVDTLQIEVKDTYWQFFTCCIRVVDTLQI